MLYRLRACGSTGRGRRQRISASGYLRIMRGCWGRAHPRYWLPLLSSSDRADTGEGRAFACIVSGGDGWDRTNVLSDMSQALETNSATSPFRRRDFVVYVAL